VSIEAGENGGTGQLETGEEERERERETGGWTWERKERMSILVHRLISFISPPHLLSISLSVLSLHVHSLYMSINSFPYIIIFPPPFTMMFTKQIYRS
jgi:hypothetical protein